MAIKEWKKVVLGENIDDYENIDIINFDDFDFHASDGWCTDFKKKWGISSVVPTKKRIATNINKEEKEIFLKECCDEYERVGKDFFIDMDETYWYTINFPTKTFGHTGAESQQVQYYGNEKLGLTAILAITAGGKFLIQ